MNNRTVVLILIIAALGAFTNMLGNSNTGHIVRLEIHRATMTVQKEFRIFTLTNTEPVTKALTKQRQMLNAAWRVDQLLDLAQLLSITTVIVLSALLIAGIGETLTYTLVGLATMGVIATFLISLAAISAYFGFNVYTNSLL